jgi:hypothetical protein
MARGRQRAQWDRTAQLSVLIANPHRDVQKHPEPFEPWEFHPFAEGKPPKAKKREVKMSVTCLKGLFSKGLEIGD